jgi:hypothetical protein
MKAAETVYLPGDQALASQAEMLPGEHIGTIVPQRDLGVDFTELDPLHLLESEFKVFRTEVDGSEHFEISIDHPAFGADALVAFLKEVAPHKQPRIDSKTIQGDWRLPETAKLAETHRRIEEQRGIVHEDPPRDVRLMQLHKKLGEDWTEFMRSRETWMDVIAEEERFPYRYNDLFYCCMQLEMNEGRDHTGAIYDLAELEFKTVGDTARILKLVGIEDAEQHIEQAIRWASMFSPREFKDGEPIPADYDLTTWEKYDFHQFVSELTEHRWLPAEQRDTLIELGQAVAYHKLKTPNGGTFTRRKDRLAESLQTSYQKRQKAVQGPFEVETMPVTLINKSGETETMDLRIPGSEVQLGDVVKVAPIISWTKRGRTRAFETPRHVQREPFAQVDGLLGLLAVAYVSPHIRAKWPVKESVIKRGDTQFMGPAQVPTQALRHRDALSKSQLIRRAEQLAD